MSEITCFPFRHHGVARGLTSVLIATACAVPPVLVAVLVAVWLTLFCFVPEWRLAVPTPAEAVALPVGLVAVLVVTCCETLLLLPTLTELFGALTIRLCELSTNCCCKISWKMGLTGFCARARSTDARARASEPPALSDCGSLPGTAEAGLREVRARDCAAARKVKQPKLLELLCPREDMVQDLPLRVICFEDLRRQGDATRFLRPCTRCADSETCKTGNQTQDGETIHGDLLRIGAVDMDEIKENKSLPL